MLNRMKAIAKKMEVKLKDEAYVATLYQHRPRQYQNAAEMVYYEVDVRAPVFAREWDDESIKIEFEKINTQDTEYTIAEDGPVKYYFKLLKCACDCKMLAELNELLQAAKEFGINYDINYRWDRLHRGNQRENLLSMASFHGHLQVVEYLVEKQGADVNAVADDYGNKVLHRVARGDSFPLHHHSYGCQHAEVAQYLIDHNANLTSINRMQETPLKIAEAHAPTLYEMVCGRDTTIAYFADKVRPVFQAELEKKNRLQNQSVLEEQNKRNNTHSLFIQSSSTDDCNVDQDYLSPRAGL